MKSHRIVPVLVLAACCFHDPRALAIDHANVPRPDAVVDLGSAAGLALLSGAWSTCDAGPIEVDHHLPGADGKPTGAASRTLDLPQHMEGGVLRGASWQPVAPTQLDTRRATGRLSFAWYRLVLTLPERVGDLDLRDTATAVFEIVVDDYAEVWVNGQLPLAFGTSGGPAIRGYNAANRVVLGRDVHPGDRFDITVFAANGPLSAPPANFIWIRSATIELYRATDAPLGSVMPFQVHQPAEGIDGVITPDTRLEKLADGFRFTEGPLWFEDALLFSDPNSNVIHRWSDSDGLSVYRVKSGYKGVDIGGYSQPGSNGLAVDPAGRLTVCEHGNRRITRTEKNGATTVLADRYRGKRLNSPNDLVYKRDGALYFSDPPFGLPAFHDDPRRELDFCGVFRWQDGELTLLVNDLLGPNGLAFSPDEKYLYVTNWDVQRKVVMRYPVLDDGTLGPGSVFFDMVGAPGEEALDGIKVDPRGNLFVSGPGGLWLIGPDARHLGTLALPELPANLAFGDDGHSLYLTARTGLYRLRPVSLPLGN